MVKMMGSTGRKKAVNKAEISQSDLQCSKCQQGAFEDRNAFYVHVLECGGQTDWDVSKKKKKKKRNILRRTNSTENNGRFL